jgi:hypothetical protein
MIVLQGLIIFAVTRPTAAGRLARGRRQKRGDYAPAVTTGTTKPLRSRLSA